MFIKGVRQQAEDEGLYLPDVSCCVYENSKQ